MAERKGPDAFMEAGKVHALRFLDLVDELAAQGARPEEVGSGVTLAAAVTARSLGVSAEDFQQMASLAYLLITFGDVVIDRGAKQTGGTGGN